MSQTANERHRAERGIILRLLAEDRGEQTSFIALWRMMDRRGFPVSKDGLSFHLTKYLAPQGYVELRRAKQIDAFSDDTDLNPDQVIFVKLAPGGLQVLNRAERDPEVAV